MTTNVVDLWPNVVEAIQIALISNVKVSIKPVYYPAITSDIVYFIDDVKFAIKGTEIISDNGYISVDFNRPLYSSVDSQAKIDDYFARAIKLKSEKRPEFNQLSSDYFVSKIGEHDLALSDVIVLKRIVEGVALLRNSNIADVCDIDKALVLFSLTTTPKNKKLTV